VLPFADPVRYKNAMGRDGIVMRGTELSATPFPPSAQRAALPRYRVRKPRLGAVWAGRRIFFASESFIDEVAATRGLDPVFFRLQLLEDMPRGRKVVDTVAEMSNWGRARDGRALGLRSSIIQHTDCRVVRYPRPRHGCDQGP